MISPIKDFGQTAIRLSKNPLGILSLFQVLIYGIAGFIFSNLTNAPPEILKILVWFFALFPIAVLFVFFILVVFHHTKLYAPSDYSDEANFMGAIEKGLKKSDKFSELENITKQVKKEIESHPLFVFARFSIKTQRMIKKIHLENEIDLNKYSNIYDEIQEEITKLEKEYQWIERDGEKILLSEKGKKEISCFIELTIPRAL